MLDFKVEKPERLHMKPEEIRKLLRQDYLSPNQMAKLFGVSYGTIINRIKDGKIEAEKTGNYLLTNQRYRISRHVAAKLWEEATGTKLEALPDEG